MGVFPGERGTEGEVEHVVQTHLRRLDRRFLGPPVEQSGSYAHIWSDRPATKSRDPRGDMGVADADLRADLEIGLGNIEGQLGSGQLLLGVRVEPCLVGKLLLADAEV